MRTKERGFKRVVQVRSSHFRFIHAWIEGTALPPEALRLSDDGDIPDAFQASAEFWDDLIDLGLVSGAIEASAAGKPANELRKTLEPASRPDHNPATGMNGASKGGPMERIAPQEWNNYKQAAAFLGVSTKHVSRLVSKRDLSFERRGGKQLIPRSALEQYARNREPHAKKAPPESS